MEEIDPRMAQSESQATDPATALVGEGTIDRQESEEEREL